MINIVGYPNFRRITNIGYLYIITPSFLFELTYYRCVRLNISLCVRPNKKWNGEVYYSACTEIPEGTTKYYLKQYVHDAGQKKIPKKKAFREFITRVHGIPITSLYVQCIKYERNINKQGIKFIFIVDFLLTIEETKNVQICLSRYVYYNFYYLSST